MKKSRRRISEGSLFGQVSSLGWGGEVLCAGAVLVHGGALGVGARSHGRLLVRKYFKLQSHLLGDFECGGCDCSGEAECCWNQQTN